MKGYVLGEYSCGCIGFPLEIPSKGTRCAMLIKCCGKEEYPETEDNTLVFVIQYMKKKTFKVLSDQQVMKFISLLDDQLSDGQKFRDLKSILGIWRT